MKIYFKHSTMCPISAFAKREMDSFLQNLKEGEQIDFQLIDVLTNKARSDEIAEQFNIQHESPQIILVDDQNRVLWTASHRAITEKAINEAIDKNTG